MTIDALETGGSGLAGALWHLLRHAQDQPTAPQSVDEALRRAAPDPATMRQATADMPLPGDGLAAAGEWPLMVWAAGDHDRAVHDEPLAFRPERARRPLLAFGGGAHGCLGRGIVRAVVAQVAGQLVSDGWRLAPGGVRCPSVAFYPPGARLAR
jgi:cytochrome P450